MVGTIVFFLPILIAKFRDTIHVQNTCSVGSQKLEEMMWVAIRNINVYWSVIIFHNIKYSIVVMGC